MQRSIVLAALAFLTPVWLAASDAQAAGGRVHAQMGLDAWFCYLEHDETMLPGLSHFLSDDNLWYAYYSGCLFPDWGYPAGINRDAGEDGHWREFLDQYFDVLRAKYPPPWEYDAKRHIAFFFGVVTHDLTDLPWHFNEGNHVAFENRAGQKDMKNADYDGICHLFAEADYGKFPVLRGSLWFPTDDILEAFARRGKKVLPEQLEAGRQLLSAGSLGSAAFGAFAYWRNKMKYPWTNRHYQDYYYGGVQHGAALTAMCIRYWYARLQDWSCLQNMPAYSCRPPGYIAHAPCRDTTISSASPENNAGSEPLLDVSRDADGGERRALLQFTLDDVPADAKIASARLWLYRLGVPPKDSAREKELEVYAVNRAWEAGHGVTNEVFGIDGRAASAGETTWTTPWQAAGCDGADADRSATPIASTVETSSDGAGAWQTWDVSDVTRQWLVKPESNHGLLLRLVSLSGKATFVSSEAFNSREDDYCGGNRIEQRPMLIIRTSR